VRRPAGVATSDASDRRLHSETVPTRALVLRRFPARLADSRAALRHRPRTALVSDDLAVAVLVPANVSFAHRDHPSEDDRSRAPGGSGPPDANEAGESSVSRRSSHFGVRSALSRGVSSSKESDSVRLWHPCRLPRPACLGPRFIGHQALVRRPPRPVSREPRERRALHRPRIPSTGSRSARPARAETRTNPRSPRRE